MARLNGFILNSDYATTRQLAARSGTLTFPAQNVPGSALVSVHQDFAVPKGKKLYRNQVRFNGGDWLVGNSVTFVRLEAGLGYYVSAFSVNSTTARVMVQVYNSMAVAMNYPSLAVDYRTSVIALP